MYPVFVTGNANKLKEVRAILAAATSEDFDLESKDLDSKPLLALITQYIGVLILRV